MKVEVNLDIDKIVGDELATTIKMIYDEIRSLEEEESLEQFQVRDLIDNKRALKVLIEVYDYYTVRGDSFDYMLGELD